MIIGSQISAARKLLNWKQQDLGKRIGGSIASISQYERGLVIPNKQMEKIVAAFEEEGITFKSDDEIGVSLRRNGKG